MTIALFCSTKDRALLLGLLTLRMITLVLLLFLLSMHMRSMRVFRWEQTVSGGLIVTYCISILGLVLCTGINKCSGTMLQPYFCSIGAVLFAVNAAVMLERWYNAGELTLAIAELLIALGVKIRRQIMIKVCLSIATAVALIIDLAITPLLFSSE